MRVRFNERVERLMSIPGVGWRTYRADLANAFSEPTDPAEQRARFVHEAAVRYSLGRQSYPLPEKFLDEMASMPPAGIALGVDRLVMVLLDAAGIDEVVAFTPEDL